MVFYVKAKIRKWTRPTPVETLGIGSSSSVLLLLFVGRGRVSRDFPLPNRNSTIRCWWKIQKLEKEGAAMATAMCGRIALTPSHLLNPKLGDKLSHSKGHYINRAVLMPISAAGPGKGGGLLEKPTIEKATPGRESEFDLRKKRKISPPYRVLLHNDNFNKREYVVQVLMKVIPGMSLDNAVNIMQEAHHNGMAVVIVCAQADAEEHCMQLRGNGLLSSIEPASGGC